MTGPFVSSLRTQDKVHNNHFNNMSKCPSLLASCVLASFFLLEESQMILNPITQEINPSGKGVLSDLPANPFVCLILSLHF